MFRILGIHLLFIILPTLLGCGLAEDLGTFFTSPTVESVDRPYVIMISIDGYRPDYTDRFNPPTLSQIRKKGVSSDYMIPVFPSDTFPDHVSLVTGLYPEGHGIVANNFYDPDLKLEFNKNRKKDVENSVFFQGTPLWVAAEKAGVHAAALFWPGSEVAIDRIRPSSFYYYERSLSHRALVDQVITLMELPDSKRPHLVNLYFSSIDVSGHKFGPTSENLREDILAVDSAIKRLLDKGKNLGLRINYVLLSGHGMALLDQKSYIILEDLVDVRSPYLKFYGDKAFYSIHSETPSLTESTYKSLKSKAVNFSVYRRSEVPKHLHYSNNKRVGDIVLIANPPFSLYLTNKEHMERIKAKTTPGGHGYDPIQVKSMNTFFYAIGPNFKQSLRIPEFESIHVYPMILRVLGIPIPKGIDGKATVLDPILVEPNKP